jgi:HD-GYP domain-containing protein (c-di-GMP phosphodiesterase class II)
MRSLLRAQTASALLVCAVGVALPAATLVLVGRNEAHPGDGMHFYGVGFTAVAATVAAVVLTVVGARRSDVRTVLVGTAFSVMAALLALHGLSTPGMLVGWNGLIAFTGGATLPLGAAVLALAALPAVNRPQNVRRLIVLQIGLLLAVALVGTVGMLVPDLVPSVPEASSPLALALLAVGLLIFAFLGVRSINTFLLTRRNSDLLVVIGLSFLATALVGALVLNYMQLGWWLGHAFELLGILLVGIPVALDLRRAQPSRSLTGGPRAGELVQAEHAFLGGRVRALTLRLAEKDEYTEGHTRRVALRAVQVGEELGLPPHKLRTLATGGLLHDIGKLSVPDEILKKPGSLDEDEFAVIKRHPEWGHKLLGELGGFSDAVRRLVLDHHERLDGAGYPNGRSACELDLETRILTVCDVYDALLSVRVYRDAWTHAQAIGLLHEQTGSAFDAACVGALERVLARDASLSLGIAV